MVNTKMAIKNVAKKGPAKDLKISMSSFFITGILVKNIYMIPANVKLSKSELSLACDASFILTKNAIIEKVYQLFGILVPQFQQQLNNIKTKLPHEISVFSPKIYRGEKYRELPYVMLDYPRCFIKEDVFAVRCLFWWGNHFSITLHLSGKYADSYAAEIIKNLFTEKESDWYICINENQWEHHFKKDNFVQANHANSLNVTKFVQQKRFLKIARRLPIERWEDVLDFFYSANEKIFRLFKGA
jgi:hypothetical protein